MWRRYFDVKNDVWKCHHETASRVNCTSTPHEALLSQVQQPLLFVLSTRYVMITTLYIHHFFLLLVFYFIVSQTKPSRKILFSKSSSAFLQLDDSDSGDKFQACSCRLQAAGVAEPRPFSSSALFEDNIVIRSVAFATAGCSSLIGPSLSNENTVNEWRSSSAAVEWAQRRGARTPTKQRSVSKCYGGVLFVFCHF